MTAQILLLLAEDEPVVQMSAQDLLESGGYSVLAASNGVEAMAALEERHSEIAGLVTDIQLGGKVDGWTLARHARELNPHICVVYTTGDSAAEWPANGVPGSLILQKPYAEAQLLTAISSLLNKVAVNVGSATPTESP